MAGRHNRGKLDMETERSHLQAHTGSRENELEARRGYILSKTPPVMHFLRMKSQRSKQEGIDWTDHACLSV